MLWAGLLWLAFGQNLAQKGCLRAHAKYVLVSFANVLARPCKWRALLAHFAGLRVYTRNSNYGFDLSGLPPRSRRVLRHRACLGLACTGNRLLARVWVCASSRQKLGSQGLPIVGTTSFCAGRRPAQSANVSRLRVRSHRTLRPASEPRAATVRPAQNFCQGAQ